MIDKNNWLKCLRNIFLWVTVLIAVAVAWVFALYAIARLDGNGMMMNTYEIAWDWSRSVGLFIIACMWGLYYFVKIVAEKRG